VFILTDTLKRIRRSIFARNLKRAREKKMMPAEEAATRAGVSIATWYKYESGDQWPRTEDQFARVCKAVSLKPQDTFRKSFA